MEETGALPDPFHPSSKSAQPLVPLFCGKLLNRFLIQSATGLGRYTELVRYRTDTSSFSGELA